MAIDQQAVIRRAGQLRKRAERLEALAQQRQAILDELGKLDAEIAREMAEQEKTTILDVDSFNPSNVERLVGQTQQEAIRAVLTWNGPLTRQQLFDALNATGKAPPNVDQLSAILRRMKQEKGWVDSGEDGRWFLVPSPENQSKATLGAAIRRRRPQRATDIFADMRAKKEASDPRYIDPEQI